jgi:hypothetical protein
MALFVGTQTKKRTSKIGEAYGVLTLSFNKEDTKETETICPSSSMMTRLLKKTSCK